MSVQLDALQTERDRLYLEKLALIDTVKSLNRRCAPRSVPSLC